MANILLVSEDEKKGKELQDILQKNSYEFSFADNQTMANDILKAHHPDIVILDNEVKNFELKLISKKIKSYDNILTILLTNDGEVEPELLKNSNAFLQEQKNRCKNFQIRTRNLQEAFTN